MKTIISIILLVVFMTCTANAVTVTGTVTSSDSKPVPGAKVYAIKRVGDEDPKIVANTVSAADGSFKMDLEPIGTGCQSYVLAARTEDGYFGWSGHLRWEHINDKNASVAICGSTVGEYKGKITDNKGNPLSGVRVTPDGICVKGSDFLTSRAGVDMFKPLMQFSSAVTNDQGAYVLKNIPEIADLDIIAEKSGYAQQRVYSENIHDLILMPAGSITGRVIGVGGKSVKDLDIYVKDDSSSIHTVTDEDGSYKFEPLLPGAYHVTLVSDELAAAAIKDVKVIAGKTVKVKDMHAVKGVLLRGKVVDVGTKKPLSTVFISISGPADPGSPSSIVYETDEKGIFEFRVVPGKYKIKAYSFGYTSLSKSVDNEDTYNAIANVSSKGNKDVLIKLKKVPVGRGKVFDEKGKPVPNVSVYATWGYEADRTDSNGKFEIILPSQNEVRTVLATQIPHVYVVAADHNLNLAVVEFIDRAALLKGNVILHLKPIRALTVTVTDKAGTPIQNADVVVWREAIHSDMFSMTTNAAGKLSTMFYDGETCSIGVRHKGYSDYNSEDVVVGSPDWKSEITVVLEPESANPTEPDESEE